MFLEMFKFYDYNFPLAIWCKNIFEKNENLEKWKLYDFKSKLLYNFRPRKLLL